MALKTGILAGGELAEVRETIAAPGSPFCTAGLSDTGVIFDIAVDGYPTVIVTLYGSYTGLAVTWEMLRGVNGQDNTDWYSVTPVNAATPSASQASGYLGTSQVLIFPTIGATRFRARQTIAPTVDKLHVHVALVASPLLQYVYGQSPDNAALAGWPVRIGARAVSAMPADATTGRASDLLATLQRKLLVYPWSIPELTWSYATVAAGITDDNAVTIKAAAGSSKRNYVGSISLQNVDNDIATYAAINDGAAGALLWGGWLPANMTSMFTPPLKVPLRGSTNTLLELKLATTGAKVYFSAQGWTD